MRESLTSLRDLGERALIARFTRDAPSGTVNPLGFRDDAAVIPVGDDYLVASVDAFRATTHFPDAMTAEEAGAFTAECAFSDVAAMGATPEGALLALGLPEDEDPAWLDGFRDGFLGALDRLGAELIGGDTKPHAEATAAVTALGRVPRERILRRNHARPSDLIAVTGSLGGAGAGLEALRAGHDRALATRLLHPRARVAEGVALAATRGTCTAAMDASDGFALAVREIARASGDLGFELDLARVPVAEEALTVADGDRERALEWALHAGGDYELVVTVERTEALLATRAVREAGGVLTFVGHVTAPGSGAWVTRADGTREPLDARGVEHFRA